MTDPSRADAPWGSDSRQRPSELWRTYARDPQSPRPDEVERLISALDFRQNELEVQNQKLQEAQRQLEAYRDRYVDLYDFAPVGYVTLDEEGYIQEINLAGATLLGRDRGELVGYPFTDCVVAADRATFLEHIRTCCTQRQDVTSELGLIAKDGRLVAVQLHSVPVNAIEHEGTFCKTAVTDITDRRRQEKAIRESELFYRTLIETLPVTVVLASPQGLATYISPAAKEMFDISPGEGLGTVPTDWIAPEHHEIVRQRMRQVMVELRPQPPVEYKILKRDGSPVWAHVASAPFLDSEGRLAGVVTVCQDVTARKQAEEALRENETRLRLAQQAARAGTWDLDLLTGRIIVSDETWGLWGVASREAPESFDWLAAVYPDDRPLAETKFRQAMQHPGDADYEYRITWPDGQVRWHHARGRTLADPGGRPVRLVGITTDVTERKQAEQRLRESEERLRLAIRGADMGWWDWDLLSGQMTADDQCKALWGLPPTAQTSYELTMELTHPEDRPLLQQRIQEALEAPDERDVEFRTVWPNGTIRWLLVCGRTFRDDRGRPLRLMGLVMDVTARKHAEQALRESQDRLRLALESAELGWWNWDFAAGAIEGDNRTQSLLGSRDTTIPFEGILEHTHPDDRSWLRECTVELQSRAGNYEVEFRVVWPDGSVHWVAARGRSFANAEGKPVRAVGIAMDITESKRAAEEVAASKAAADQANRAKDHFLAVLSHELRTPLTPVVMGVSMLENRPDLDPATRETLAMVRRNAEIEAGLIDDLLDVTRISREKIELLRSAVELCTIIQRAVEVCQPDIDARGLHFGVDWGPSRPYWVEADGSRLQQVFWNLLKNAIKFTPHGGCLGIRCSLQGPEIRSQGPESQSHGPKSQNPAPGPWPPAPGPFAAQPKPQTLNPEPSYVVVEVNDTGIGIEPEALPHIFNAFEQAERSITRKFGGLGLGLTISKGLVEMHGGTIEAHSEGRDKGATFRIRLPLTAPVSLSQASPTAAAARLTVRPLHILLVEDHGVTAKILRMVLAEEGHTVETAGDVATALQLAGQRAFDLLLSDLGLPDGNGYDLLRQLREHGHRFPGIALSGYGQGEDIQRSLEAGFSAHLTKPASREALVEAIASVTVPTTPDQT